MRPSASGMTGTMSLFFQDIKLAHSVFALPFAAVGYVLSGAGVPSVKNLMILLVCMVTARSYAMGLNRYLDRDIDGKNPRTAARMIPSGRLNPGSGLAWTLGMAALFILAAFQVNDLTGWLSLPLLMILGFYSLMKKISHLTHWYLGLCLGLAPVAVSVALTGSVNLAVVLTGLGVMLWTAGFDILYSLQDLEFDRREGLHSVPAKLGIQGALKVSRLCFCGMILSLGVAGMLAGRSWFYLCGVILVAGILAFEQWLVRDCVRGVSEVQINKAFFTVNGWVSVVFYLMVQLDVSLLS